MAVYRIEIYTKLDAMYKVNLLKNNLARVFSCLFFLLTIQDEPQNVQHQKIIIYIQTHTIKKNANGKSISFRIYNSQNWILSSFSYFSSSSWADFLYNCWKYVNVFACCMTCPLIQKNQLFRFDVWRCAILFILFE